MLLVFVDVMKELPATLIMRPFNFDTLAAHLYLASDELLADRGRPPNHRPGRADRCCCSTAPSPNRAEKANDLDHRSGDGASHHFGAVRVVDDVSLRVGPGELVCLGASGCSKTTTPCVSPPA